MNEEKLEQILNKIGRTDVPPNVALIAERASRNFDAALKIAQPKQWFFTPGRLIAAAAVIILVFAAGRWSKEISPAPSSKAVYAGAPSAYTISKKNPDSFWQQKATTVRQLRPAVQTNISYTEMLNVYKQYLKK